MTITDGIILTGYFIILIGLLVYFNDDIDDILPFIILWPITLIGFPIFMCILIANNIHHWWSKKS